MMTDKGFKMTLRKRLMGDVTVFNTPPTILLEKLNKYLHIKDKIEALWGTAELQEYLDKLFSDTRKDTRKGFPVGIGKPLLQLSLLHCKHLESRGIKIINLEGSEFASKVKH